MKKIYKTIASLSLSLLAIGAMGQTQGTARIIKTQNELPSTTPVVRTTPSAHSKGVTTNTTPAFLNYEVGDDAFATSNGRSFTGWIVDPINRYYTASDTAANLLPPNYNDLNSVTVAFDTLWDDYTQEGYGVQPGSVVLDSIYMEYTYHNVSGNTDTLIFWVCEVDARGFPTQHVIGSDTLFFGSAQSHPDTSYLIRLPLVNPIPISGTARHGWNFCITADYRDISKTDTFGISHYSSKTECTVSGTGDNGEFCDAETGLGVPCGKLTACNSWALGWYRYNDDTTYGGNGTTTPLFWPDTTGGLTGYRTNAKGDTITRTPCTGSTFLYSNKQDIAISAMITFDNPAGINNVSASGLSVGQNYPNPFNEQTQIKYSLTQSSDITFTVYDITGRVIMTNDYGTVTPGQHEINLSANSFSPGIYFYTFNVNGSTVTKKMVITE